MFIESFVIEIVGGVFSTFLGFVLAIYLQQRTDRKKTEKRIAVMILSISEELADISLTLKQYLDKDKIIHRTILTPNFDALMNSGMLIDLIERDIYSYVIDGFSMVKRLNDEQHSTTNQERVAYMQEIVKCSDNIIFLTKKQKEEVK